MADGQPRSEEIREEYRALRAEVDRRSTTQQALVVLNLTGIAAVATTALKATPKPGQPLFDTPRAFFLIALIPLLSFTLAQLWIDHDVVTGRIARYIKNHVETKIEMNWETASRLPPTTPRRVDWRRFKFVLAYASIFDAASAVCLFPLFGNAHGAGRWAVAILAAGLTVWNALEWFVGVGIAPGNVAGR